MGFEPTISAGERPKTYALDRAATGIGEQDGEKDKALSGEKRKLNNKEMNNSSP